MSNVQAAIKRNGVVLLLILLAALAVLLAGVRSGGPDTASADPSVLPYQDPSLPVDQRVADPGPLVQCRSVFVDQLHAAGGINQEDDLLAG